MRNSVYLNRFHKLKQGLNIDPCGSQEFLTERFIKLVIFFIDRFLADIKNFSHK